MERLTTSFSVEGLASGRARIYPGAPEDLSFSSPSGAPLEDFRNALSLSRTEIEQTQAEGPLKDILSAHLEMLSDPVLEETVEADISKGMGAKEAVEAASEEISAMFDATGDEYFISRKDDVRDVCRRIVRNMAQKKGSPEDEIPEDTVIVATELLPSDTVRMDFSKVRALVLEKGSVTGHVAILARGYGIPVLFGIKKEGIRSGDRLLVDGYIGELTVSPDDEAIRQFSEKVSSHTFAVEVEGECPVKVYANAAGLEEVRRAMEGGADGIGLFRSEFLYMRGDALPTEEEQFAIYSEAARLCKDTPLTVRTLDIGGDKPLPYMELPREENPFLGVRAIRLSFSKPDIFKTQLRAILRASAHGKIRILLPMITRVEEVRKAKELIAASMDELRAENLPFDPGIEVGIMVETPAAVFIAEDLAAESDFFSVGTNDLTQYVMAADRGNASVAYLYNPADPAVLRALSIVSEAARRASIPLGICGEAAAEPALQGEFLKMGFSYLSVPAALVGETRRNLMKIEI